MKTLLLALIPFVAIAQEPDWIEIDKKAVRLLQEYIRIPSINPPADTRATATFLTRELESAGFKVNRFQPDSSGCVNLLTRLEGRDRTARTLVLMTHMDVVPVDAKAWSMDPFGGEIKDGYIWGRGALDMKGIGIQQLMALVQMKRLGIVPPRDIVFAATCDEETGGAHGVKWLIANHWDKLNPAFVMDEGGFGSRDILVPNKLAFGIAVGEKQLAWLRLRAKGTAAHGSQPIPDNANDILLTAIGKAMALPVGGKRHPVVDEMIRNLGELVQNKLTNAIQKNTMSLTTLRAGVGDPPKVNVIPSSSEATLDCRLLPGVNSAEFISEVKARINDPRVTVELLSEPLDTGVSSSQTPMFAVIKAAILKHNPTAVVTPMLVPYGTDSSNFRMKKIPSYGLTPMVVDAATLATMHSDAERIPVAEFLKGLRIYFDVLRSNF